MKKFSVIYLVITILFISSCQKNSNTTSGGGSVNNNNAGTSPSNATTYYGILTAYNFQSLSGGVLGPNSNYASAFFSNTATAYLNPSTFVKVNNVAISGSNLTFSSFYYTSSSPLNFSPIIWQVNGLGSIPSFTFTNSNAMPTYTGYATLPDTIHKNQSITISVTGITGGDEVTVGISDGTNQSGHTVAQNLTTGATSVTFPASSFSSLTPTNSGAFINISCQKNNVQSVNGVAMNFENTYQLTKTISIK